MNYDTENHTDLKNKIKQNKTKTKQNKNNNKNNKTGKSHWKTFTKETTLIIALKYFPLLFKNTEITLKT